MIWHLWKMMPWVDTETGNWSLMRSVVIVFTACICHAIEVKHEISWPMAFVIATLIVGALSKNMQDFTRGANAIWQRRRSSDQRAASEADIK